MGVKNGTIRRRDEGLWDDATGRGKSFVRQKPAFPKSVFAAGTAKRTTEMLRRKTALVHEDDEEQRVGEPERRASRGAGRTLNCVKGCFSSLNECVGFLH